MVGYNGPATVLQCTSVRVACSLARMTEWWPTAGSVQWPCTCLSRSKDPRGRLLSHRPLCPSVLACDVMYCSTMRRNYIAVTVWAQLDEWWADWQDVRGDRARSLLRSKGLNNSQSRDDWTVLAMSVFTFHQKLKTYAWAIANKFNSYYVVNMLLILFLRLHVKRNCHFYWSRRRKKEIGR